MSQIRHALISVTDKTGVVEFARGLSEKGLNLLSTGGTAKLLREAGLKVTDVSEYTGHPECLDGRVKTLHPRVHGGILADRTNKSHIADMERLGFEAIDVVAVNLYDFAGNAQGKDLPLSQVIAQIDIGGPAMLRAAAKNHNSVYVAVDPIDYPAILNAYSETSEKQIMLKQRLAAKVFATTAAYDQMIAADLTSRIVKDASAAHSDKTPLIVSEKYFPEPKLNLSLQGVQTLRYGENSHQKASLFTWQKEPVGLAAAKMIQGKELSYNNFLDLDSASAVVADLDPIPAISIIKHTNPCGTAAVVGESVLELFKRALSCDPQCAFGGIVASNVPIDGPAAKAMTEIFLECVIAPGYSDEALIIFSAKKNLRVMLSNVTQRKGRLDPWMLRSVEGGLLIQSPDNLPQNLGHWMCASKTKPTSAQLAELSFAMTLGRHIKSNAIVVTRLGMSLGIGAGQMSRVDSARIAIDKARELGHGMTDAVAASDAFFPFRDTVDLLAAAGIRAIVQPGGSMRDQESIDAANENGIVMMITGMRHFKH